MPSGVLMLLANLDGSVGGAQRQARLLADAMARRGVPVVLVNQSPGVGAGRGATPEGVERVALPVLPWLPRASFLGGLLVWTMRNRHRFAVIHAHSSSAGLSAGLVGALLRKPVVVKITGMRSAAALTSGRIGHRLRRWLLTRTADVVVAVSSDMLQSFPRALQRCRCVLIPNGVELTAADGDAARSPAALAGLDGPVVLYVGRLAEVKGAHRLIDMWHAMPRRDAAMLVVVGDGPLRGTLEAESRARGLDRSVRFVGTQADVRPFYRAAQVFVLPSASEGLSNALLEAMAAGVPVVASDVPGNREVIDDGISGVLANWADPGAAAAPVARLLDDAALRRRLGEAGRTRAAAFAIESVADRYCALYREVTARPRVSGNGVPARAPSPRAPAIAGSPVAPASAPPGPGPGAATLRVALVTSQWGPPWTEGVRNIARCVVEYFTAAGAEVAVVAPRRRHGRWTALTRRIPFVPSIRFALSALRDARRTGADVVIAIVSLSPVVGLRARLLRWWTGKPLVLYVTGRRRLIHGYHRLLRAEAVLVGSPALVPFFPGAEVVPPPTDPRRWPARTRSTPPAPPVVLFLGAFERCRGVEDLVRAMEHVPPALGATLRLAWNGVGRDRYPEIVRTVQESRAADRIEILESADVGRLYQEATVVVIPRIAPERMAFPLRIVEAVHMGVPLVVTRINRMDELVEGCGLAVPPRDPRALGAAITRLLTDRELYARLVAGCGDKARTWDPARTLATMHAVVQRCR